MTLTPISVYHSQHAAPANWHLNTGGSSMVIYTVVAPAQQYALIKSGVFVTTRKHSVLACSETIPEEDRAE